MKKLVFFLSLMFILITNINSVSAQVDKDTISRDEYNKYYIPSEKNPGISFIFSFAVPGAGQMYNEEVGLGFGIFGVTVGSLVMVGSALRGENDNSAVFGFVMFATWIYSIIDAPITSVKITEESRRKRAELYKKYGNMSLLLDDENYSYSTLTPYFKNNQVGFSYSYHF